MSHQCVWSCVCVVIFKSPNAEKVETSDKMLLVWREVTPCFLFLSIAEALNVSHRCMQDTQTFLLELSKDKPAKYAALSKSDTFLQKGIVFREAFCV